MKRQIAAIMTFVMSAILCVVPAYAEAETEADSNTEFLEALNGTYDELFTVIDDDFALIIRVVFEYIS